MVQSQQMPGESDRNHDSTSGLPRLAPLLPACAYEALQHLNQTATLWTSEILDMLISTVTSHNIYMFSGHILDLYTNR